MKIWRLSSLSYDVIEKAIFVDQMPPAIRTALASKETLTNDQLVARVGAIIEEFRFSGQTYAFPHVSAVGPPSSAAASPIPWRLMLPFVLGLMDRIIPASP